MKIDNNYDLMANALMVLCNMCGRPVTVSMYNNNFAIWTRRWRVIGNGVREGNNNEIIEDTLASKMNLIIRKKM